MTINVTPLEHLTRRMYGFLHCTARTEVLDQVLIPIETHLRNVMSDYIQHYNKVRRHQGLQQRCPIPIKHAHHGGKVKRRDVLGGVIHEYEREAA